MTLDVSASNKHAAIAVSLATALIVFQATPLLWHRPFYTDWINHVWTIEYYADHLLRHGSFPTTIDVRHGFGNPLPVFYGMFFYPLLSLLGALTGADLAVRISCGALLLLPLLSFATLFHRFLSDRPMAVLLAVALNSSVYQLTNLYARSALTEFVAIQLLLLCLSLLFYGLTTASRTGKCAIGLACACGALALGSHPITFYTSAFFVLPVLALGVFALRTSIPAGNFKHVVAWSAVAVMVLLPWLLITLRYRGEINIATGAELAYFPRSIDSFLGKLGLFYIDPRVAIDGIGSTSTPFLDAPFPTFAAVSLLAIFAVIRSKRNGLWWIALPAGVSILLMVYVSCLPTTATPRGCADCYIGGNAGPLHALLYPIQFVYRLAGTFTIAVAGSMTLALAMLRGTVLLAPRTRSVVFFGAIISVALIAHKFYETFLVFRAYPQYKIAHQANFKLPRQENDRVLLLSWPEYSSIVNDVARYPFTFVAGSDFAMPNVFSSSMGDEAGRTIINVRVTDWGQPLSVTCEDACLLRTNMVPSRFMRIWVNDVQAHGARVSRYFGVDILADAGTHTLRVERVGTLPRYVTFSVWAMLIWFISSAAAFIAIAVAQLVHRRAHRSLDQRLAA